MGDPAAAQQKEHPMRNRDIPDSTIAVVKKARLLGYSYAEIAAYFVLNQGRIADIMKGRIGPQIQPAEYLPDDFPALRKAA